MQSISCDVCKKKVENSFTGRTFFYYDKFSVCEACKDNLELQIKAQVRNRDPYAIDWYNKYICDSLEKAVQKGKI